MYEQPMCPYGERTGTSSSPNRLEYTSDRHPRAILDMLNLLRQSQELCDVVLNVGSREPIYAHRFVKGRFEDGNAGRGLKNVLVIDFLFVFGVFRVVLSSCSPYFRAMFTGELAESRQTEITLKDIDENAMGLLINFCYTSKIVIDETNVQTLLPAGND